jgi:hypothetical protein
MQSKADILRTLSEHQKELRTLGVRGLFLFGSAARNEHTAASDVDILVDFRHKSFDAYMDVKEFLENILERPVDLVTREALKPSLRDSILEECVHAPGF